MPCQCISQHVDGAFLARMVDKSIMNEFEKLLADYDYTVPPEAIAQAPASPRDSAKLLIYDRTTQAVSFDIFRNVAKHLPSRAVLVLNDTKVIPARLKLTRATGGAVEILYLRSAGDEIVALANKKLLPGISLYHHDQHLFTVTAQDGKHYRLQPTFPVAEILDMLERAGVMPLPPYIKHSPLSATEQREQYQTVFAQYLGSVAAPTASLHFTPELIDQLPTHGFSLAYLTLHVNLGTFAPLNPEQISREKLHQESLTIPPQTAAFLAQARHDGRPIIPVGTTALRALESAIDHDKIIAGARTTDIFIRPGYEFQITNGLITNFHVPRSSLMMLAAALVGRKKLLELYSTALKNNFRFFSFGDAMLIK